MKFVKFFRIELLEEKSESGVGEVNAGKEGIERLGSGRRRRWRKTRSNLRSMEMGGKEG